MSKLIVGNVLELIPREPAPAGMDWLNKSIYGRVEDVQGPLFWLRPPGFTMTVFKFRVDENEELAVNTVNGRLYELRTPSEAQF